MEKKILLEIWSDLICPWCWIGKTRFEKALHASGLADRFEIKHRAFRLGPGEPVAPVEQMLASKYGRSTTEVDQMLAQVESTAAREGLEYHLRGTLSGDTIDGQRLVLWSATQGLEKKTLERLYRAYFTEHTSIFDRANLLRLAGEIGLEVNAARTVLESESFRSDVEDDELRARELGANGVPFFLFDGKYVVNGAQPTGVFRKFLEEITG